MMAEFQNDDHPHIIKMPDEPPTSEYGLGYEIFHSMKRHSKNIAQYIVETDESQTFGELLEECIKVAINLKAENLSEDDIVALCMDTHKDSCVPYTACLFNGIKVIPMNNNLAEVHEQAALLKKVEPKIIFVDNEALQDMEQVLKIAELNIKLVVLGEKSNGHSSYSDFLVASKSDIEKFQPIKLNSNKGTAVIFSSSGTSGKVKPICLSHHTLLTRTDGDYLPHALIFARMYWLSHFLGTFRYLRSGSSRVVMRESDETNLWKVIEKYKIYSIFGTLFKMTNLLKHTKPKDVDISSLKVLGGGGVAFPVPTIQKLKEIIPGVIILQAYGLTEIGGLGTIFNLFDPQHREWLITKPKSCGLPVEGIWYKVVDPETEEILGPNRPGELRMKSNLKMIGYYNMDSSEAFDATGWLKTGDIFEYDEDHCFYMIERINEIIRTDKGDMIPSIPEHILIEHPMVDKATVIGVPQVNGYGFPMGIVTLHEKCEIDPRELEDYVNARVTDVQKLRAGVKIIQEMPVTGSGKILKRSLRKMSEKGEL